MQLTLAEIQGALQTELRFDSCCTVEHRLAVLELSATSVCTDSRELQEGALFVCIRGEQVDGHDYALMAAERGACALLVTHNPFEADSAHIPYFLVDDTVKALGQLAAFWRQRTRAKVVAITGTAGKTTVKEVLAEILAVRGITARSHKNHNNQIGLPLSILATTGSEDFWVMEVGISHAPDMAELAPLVQPDLGLIINVGVGHTQGLGDKGVAYYKSQLLGSLAPGGVGLLCADYQELVREARNVSGQQLVFFSTQGRPVAYRAAYNGPVGVSSGSFRLWLDGEALDVEAPFRGSFGTENVIAAGAAAHLLGLTAVEIAEGFTRVTLPEHRFACKKVGDWTLIDDSYNANPLSFSRVLEAASDMAQGRAFVCVLGEMRELGSAAVYEHQQLGMRLAQGHVSAVLWKGGHGAEVKSGLDTHDYEGKFCAVNSVEEMFVALEALNLPAGVLLVKGSRANRLEEFVSRFQKQQESSYAL